MRESSTSGRILEIRKFAPILTSIIAFFCSSTCQATTVQLAGGAGQSPFVDSSDSIVNHHATVVHVGTFIDPTDPSTFLEFTGVGEFRVEDIMGISSGQLVGTVAREFSNASIFDNAKLYIYITLGDPESSSHQGGVYSAPDLKFPVHGGDDTVRILPSALSEVFFESIYAASPAQLGSYTPPPSVPRPGVTDTDGDCVADHVEILLGTDPNVRNESDLIDPFSCQIATGAPSLMRVAGYSRDMFSSRSTIRIIGSAWRILNHDLMPVTMIVPDGQPELLPEGISGDILIHTVEDGLTSNIQVLPGESVTYDLVVFVEGLGRNPLSINSYAQWSWVHDVSSLTDDRDSDGLKAVTEYAFNLDPAVPDLDPRGPGLPRISYVSSDGAGETLYLSFTFLAGFSGLSYSVHSSDDQENWQEIEIPWPDPPDDAGPGPRNWEVLTMVLPASAIDRFVSVNIGFGSLASESFLVSQPVATPTISPAGGAHSESVQVTLATPTADAVIYYTSDGSPPTIESILYTSPFTLTGSTNVNARAFREGYNDSQVANASFTIQRPFKISSLRLINGGTRLELNLCTSLGVVYHLEESPTMQAGTWEKISGSTFTAAAIHESRLIDINPDRRQRFLRGVKGAGE